MRRIHHWSAIALAAGLWASGAAQAMSFAEAFAAARENDPTYRAAAHQLEAVRQGVPIARAALLPQVNANINRSEVSGSRQFFNSLNQEVKVQLDYAAPSSVLQARLPLFNREAHKRLDQAKVQAEAAEQDYRLRGLELADRVGTAYLQVLLGEESVVLAESQVALAQGQFTRAEQRFKRGEGTRTEQALAQAALDVARVRLLESQHQLEVARRGLKRHTGRDTPALNRPIADFIPSELTPGTLGDWIELALRNNPAIEARRRNVLAARLGVERQSAAHYPRVDMVASISRAENDSVTNLGQTTTLKNIGVQVSVPLYSGGGIEAGVRQAMAEQARAEEDIRAEREAVELEVQRNHLLVASGATRVEAHRRAADSNEVAFTGAKRAQENGLATLADVLDAQTRLYQARRDLAQVRFEYLASRLRLMAQAGQTIEDISNDIDRLLPVKPAARP